MCDRLLGCTLSLHLISSPHSSLSTSESQWPSITRNPCSLVYKVKVRCYPHRWQWSSCRSPASHLHRDNSWRIQQIPLFLGEVHSQILKAHQVLKHSIFVYKGVGENDICPHLTVWQHNCVAFTHAFHDARVLAKHWLMFRDGRQITLLITALKKWAAPHPFPFSSYLHFLSQEHPIIWYSGIKLGLRRLFVLGIQAQSLTSSGLRKQYSV